MRGTRVAENQILVDEWGGGGGFSAHVHFVYLKRNQGNQNWNLSEIQENKLLR